MKKLLILFTPTILFIPRYVVYLTEWSDSLQGYNAAQLSLYLIGILICFTWLFLGIYLAIYSLGYFE